MEEAQEEKRMGYKVWIILIAILAIGFFLRIYNIDHAPPGVYPDEAVNGMDAVQAEESGNYQWFYTANNGREGLFMNMIAMSFKFFGISPLSLRIPSIVFGTLTILGTYLVAKELFQKERVGLLAGYLVAVSYWSINFSRISFRAILVPFILSFSFYFLFRAVRTKKWYDFAAGGLIFGIGLHTYIAFRIAPLILVVALMSFMLSRKDFLKEYWKGILIFITGTIITVAPILYTFYIHPEYLSSRTASVSILSPDVNQGHLFATFFRSFGLSLAKYNFWGDQNWRHNYPPYPVLDIASGIAFLFGIAYSFIRLFHLLWNRIVDGYRNSRLDKHVFLISWFFIMLVPEFMTAEGLPHALRSIGTLPAVFILAAMTFDYFFRYAERHTPFFRKLNAAMVIIVLLSIGIFNSIKYHLFWAHKTEAASSFERPLMDISEYLHTLPLQQEKIVFAESMQRIPIQVFDWKMPNTEYLYSGQINEFSPTSDNFIVILTDKNDAIISHIQDKFPELALKERKDAYGLSFYTLSK
ncbi:MAG: hypothetical protein HGB08_03980 [Candidatus Moranbacteria bacterium]|nr:hypothetical protein [Candidatus Moranbacteria bacterium]